MKSSFSLATVVCLLALPAWAAGPEGPASGRLVTIDVLIAEINNSTAEASKGEGAEGKADHRELTAMELLEMDRQGKLARSTRVHLSALEHQKATVQVGERIAVPSGRSMVGRGGGFAPRRADGETAPPQFATSYTMENVGTLVAAAARVETPEWIIIEIKLEKSWYEQPQADAGDRDESPLDVRRPKMLTLSGEASIRLRSGDPTLVQSFGSQAPGEQTTQYVVVTAGTDKESAPAPPAADTSAEASIKIFDLKNIEANSAADVIRVVGGKSLQVAFDARTNQLILKGSPVDLARFEALLQKLDEAPAHPQSPMEPHPVAK